MTSNIKTLRKYAKLKKLPNIIHLGNIASETRHNLLELFKNTPESNYKTIANRKGVYGVEHNETTPLSKTYNQHHLEVDNSFNLDCLEKFNNKFEYRFGKLDANAVIPAHLDDPNSYRFLVILDGSCIFKSAKEQSQQVMSESEVWFINSAYQHSIINKSKDRIALLGKFKINEHNTRILRTRT